MSETRPQLVLETPTGWMIRCRCRTEGWHEFPLSSKHGTWTFNGDLFCPTFTPSMNECVNPSNHPDFNTDCPADQRCHFIVTAGRIKYCDDCSHELKGQEMALDPWPEAKVKYYAAVMIEHREKETKAMTPE